MRLTDNVARSGSVAVVLLCCRWLKIEKKGPAVLDGLLILIFRTLAYRIRLKIAEVALWFVLFDSQHRTLAYWIRLPIADEVLRLFCC